jgi:hypothetical protein
MILRRAIQGHFQPATGGLQIVDLEAHMRLVPHRASQRAVGGVMQPLHGVGVMSMVGDPDARLLHPSLPRLRDIRSAPPHAG